ncbi:MAG TPA: carbamoyltransferase HypF [Solirubrobacteraceae bacterium]|nr:carbamoyltransferase HypF [Solirubrobacteraceae bacterium]
MSALRRRACARVQGTVQGVGFRPYVHRLAAELGLAGYVLNDAHGVLLEVEGEAEAVEEFLARLAPEAPPLAMIEHVEVSEGPPLGDTDFVIRASPRGGPVDAPVTPDSATCAECLRELFDPGDRRHRYPFINCTNCGPRFTIVRGVPYDRPLTTMAAFTMCARCQSEYEDPRDRRFHAQPNACPQCGPSVRLLKARGGEIDVADPVGAAAAALREGQIVAVKGVGGFHLACRADDQPAVARLRARKHREDKPFALMCASRADAEALVRLGDAEAALLSGSERPIVLAARRADARVAPSVAPGVGELGVMLPYSPLHHLLLADSGCTLVMTSGNLSDEPIAFEDEEARERLGRIADLLLVHDRPIETRTDDSVVRVAAADHPLFLRRSRGYVPAALPLPEPARRPVLACGAELKNTFCLAKGSRAWVGHHVGDLQNYETLRSFTRGIAHFEDLFAVAPELVAHDLHPEYLSTKYALERSGVELLGVQHHHAHLAAVLAEHGDPGVAVGAIFDGTGLGSDGTVWGGEFLAGDLSGFQRVGTLWPVRLPGGERAIREPWRMACAWALAAEAPDLPERLAPFVAPEAWAQIRRLAESGLASPVTSSMGRLFDAVAALCGIRPAVNYEGQAAIELEAACETTERGAYPIELAWHGELLQLDPREMIRSLVRDLAGGAEVARVASRFHRGLAEATVSACSALAAAASTDRVVLAGGVFQNRRLLEAVMTGLEPLGLRVLLPRRLPIGDGGISYGQVAVAARLT